MQGEKHAAANYQACILLFSTFLAWLLCYVGINFMNQPLSEILFLLSVCKITLIELEEFVLKIQLYG